MIVRNLYRCYLYTVFIALLVFVATVTGQLLNMLLTHTPLRGSYVKDEWKALLEYPGTPSWG